MARHRESEQDFTRNRTLGFRALVLFMMNLLKSAIQYELDTFYAQLLNREIPRREITQSVLQPGPAEAEARGPYRTQRRGGGGLLQGFRHSALA